MAITIRKATENDSEFLAQMILQSSKAEKVECIFNLIFKSNDDKVVLEKLAKLTVTKAKSQCHFSNFLIAELDGKSVGSLCTYEPRIATKQTFVDALLEVGCSENVSETLEVLYDCDFELNNRTLMFDYMEELEGFVDVGVLKALMQKSLLTARLKGYRIAQTIVEIGSLEMLLFYKKLGFTKVKEKECELYKEKFGRAGLVLLAIEF
ncbi:MAG: acyl-CoA acyltransferase [Sulfurimonas sp.]|nr:acyl-CoA acyltransferase [Sulfurimonas sp.]MBU1218078.1 acyl-CoA acyltransferase [bacterium]MBU1434759.1 acyl-CoA acyltransferase [bacterium]MBU1502747.1 acyl-CoA acyltransferase [bacterium]MBU3940131.1 acyl-CoA acyltransferase [bacterium]